jgi:hypothetical protein
MGLNRFELKGIRRKNPLEVVPVAYRLMTAGALVCLLMIALPAGADQNAVTAELVTATDQILFQEIPTVVGASQYEQKTSEAPAYISIVTAEEIKRFGYRALAEILGSVAGYYPNYDRSYNYVRTRGLSLPGDYNTRVLVLLNGHRINENIYDSSGGRQDFIEVRAEPRSPGGPCSERHTPRAGIGRKKRRRALGADGQGRVDAGDGQADPALRSA